MATIKVILDALAAAFREAVNCASTSLTASIASGAFVAAVSEGLINEDGSWARGLLVGAAAAFAPVVVAFLEGFADSVRSATEPPEPAPGT